MQAKEAIQIEDGGSSAGAACRLGDINGRTQGVIFLLTKGYYGVKPIGGATLEYGDQDFLSCPECGLIERQCRATQKGWHQSSSKQTQSRRFEEITPRWPHFMTSEHEFIALSRHRRWNSGAAS